jgi:hypothetical protein
MVFGYWEKMTEIQERDFLGWNFGLNTMDITIAIIGGVITTLYSSYTPLHLIESALLSGGVAGWAAFYVIEGVYYVVYIATGYLRKKAGVLVLASVTGAVLQFLSTGGGAEGYSLIIMLLVGGLGSGLWLAYAKWNKNFVTAWVAGAIYFATVEVVYNTFTAGWNIGIPLLVGIFIVGSIFNGILAGVVGQKLAEAVVKAGITEVEY